MHHYKIAAILTESFFKINIYGIIMVS